MNENDRIQIADYYFEKYIDREVIRNRVKELGKAISKDYAGKEPTILITLKGAMVFAADLIREISLTVRIETVIAKSYGMKIETSGEVNIIKNDIDIKDKDVIIVEDIIDTGITMTKLLKNLKQDEPKSISVCSLLFKPDKIIENVDIKYLGFSIDPLFVVGYGIDYAEQGRNLKDIYIKVN